MRTTPMQTERDGTVRGSFRWSMIMMIKGQGTTSMLIGPHRLRLRVDFSTVQASLPPWKRL